MLMFRVIPDGFSKFYLKILGLNTYFLDEVACLL